jgi:hypothetical protein
MQILVQIKNVYGQDKVYPVCDAAKTFAQLVGQQTLTDLNIRYIKQPGYAVNVMQNQPQTL